MTQDDKFFKVGYKKPPPQHQFKKGQSGNPGGRPRGSKSSGDIVIENLDKRLPIRFNGHEIKTTAFDAMIKAQVKKALEGDIKATKFLTDLRQKAEMERYYDETAANFLSRQIGRAIGLLDINPKEAQKFFDVAQIFAESNAKKGSSSHELFTSMEQLLRQIKSGQHDVPDADESDEEGGKAP
jgi:hypothetical protein